VTVRAETAADGRSEGRRYSAPATRRTPLSVDFSPDFGHFPDWPALVKDQGWYEREAWRFDRR
jgi:hypothetical protein